MAVAHGFRLAGYLDMNRAAETLALMRCRHCSLLPRNGLRILRQDRFSDNSGGSRGDSHFRRPRRSESPFEPCIPDAPAKFLVRREPSDVTGAVATVTVGRLPKCAGKLPFLGLVAPLNGGMAKNVV
jgi:hypothetical protein